MSKKLSDQLRDQMKELDDKRAAITDKAAPLRAEADRLSNEFREKRAVLIAQIREAEKDLPDVERDRSMLARALGGRRMSDAANVR